MPTTDEENAAFDAAHNKLLDELNNSSFFMKGMVVQKFNSQDGRNMLLAVVIVALKAAEDERAKAAKP